MNQKNILSTSNLSIGYKTKSLVTTIAENLSLNLQEGKLIALIGANGIGKSTLLRTLIGIQKPISGKVFLNEKDIHELDALTIAQNLSVVLTEKLPPSNLTVWELIALGRQPYTNWIGRLTETDIAKITEAIALTQIDTKKALRN
jgi:iron complex transport system ATP-binding protein